MTDRHKVKPLSLRLPESELKWYQARAAATGIPVRRLLLHAAAAYRLSCHDLPPSDDPPGADARP